MRGTGVVGDRKTETGPGGEIILDNGTLAVTVNPARGGRLTSLVHRASGLELLWRHEGPEDWPRYGVPEAEADVQGWDECCPAIGPGPFPAGPWGGVHNPAQGEVFALPWQIGAVESDSVSLSVHGLRFPYQLERELSFIAPGTLGLRYRMVNHGAHPFPFIWSAHPLFTAPAGARIELPDGITEVLIDSSENGRLGDAYGTIAWPIARLTTGAELDLRQVVPGTNMANKLYVPAVTEGRCSLIRADGLTLSLSWDAEIIPSLGIWVDTRCAGEARIALEPCLGYPDLLAAAADWGRHAMLPAFGELRWEMALSVTRA